LGIPWDKIDAAYGQHKTIYVFKDWSYVKLAHNISVPAQPKLVFKDVFKCPKHFYDKFDGYQTFIKKYLSLKAYRKVESYLKEPNDISKSVRTYTGNRNIIGHESFVITLMIILLIIAIVIFIILRKKNYQRVETSTSMY